MAKGFSVGKFVHISEVSLVGCYQFFKKQNPPPTKTKKERNKQTRKRKPNQPNKQTKPHKPIKTPHTYKNPTLIVRSVYFIVLSLGFMTNYNYKGTGDDIAVVEKANEYGLQSQFTLHQMASSSRQAFDELFHEDCCGDGLMSESMQI